MLKQGYVAPRLKSSLQKFSGSHHDLVDPYEISIFQWIFSLLRSFLSFLYHWQDFNRPLLYTWITGRVSYKKQKLITLRKQRGYLRFIRFPCCVAFLCFVCLRPVSCVPNVVCHVVNSWLPLPVFWISSFVLCSILSIIVCLFVLFLLTTSLFVLLIKASDNQFVCSKKLLL